MANPSLALPLRQPLQRRIPRPSKLTVTGVVLVGTVTLASVAASNGGNRFGVAVGTGVKAVTVTSPAFRFNPAQPLPQHQDDFWVAFPTAAPG